jgi:hypothetical protein
MLWCILALIVVRVAHSQTEDDATDCRAEAIEAPALKTRTMPNVVGCPSAQIIQYLRRTDHPPTTHPVNSSRPISQVATQDPAPGALLNQPIDLGISNGSQPLLPVPVPVPTPAPVPDHGAKPSIAQASDVSVQNHLQTQGPFRAGQSIRFTIVVANAGPSATRAVRVFFSLQNLRFISASAHCARTGCKVADLAPHGLIRIEVEAGILAAGPFRYEVTVRHGEPDPREENNTASDGGNAQPALPAPPSETDLMVTLDLQTPGPYHPGDLVDFIATVLNAGQADATNVRITLSLANLGNVSMSGACRQPKCQLTRILRGESTQVQLRGTIAAAGVFSVNVAARESQRDTDASSNSARAAGIAETPPPPPRWPTAWQVAALLALAAGALAVPLHRAWWRSRVRCRARLDPLGRSRVLGPLPLAAPTISLRTRLEPGPSTIDRSIPILKTEVSRE